ncbi:MAG: 3'(2'),5'-bisphosphate nucleotidase [Myxococcales bacterium]|nr:3'(2'),5'-bisphosphate nucleotidase [Myxococcales bacterium]
MSYDDERDAAARAVTVAAALCAEVQRGLADAGRLDKADRSPVTVADFGAQAVVSHLLGGATPGVPLVAEEAAEALRRPGAEALRDQVAELVQRAVGLGPEAALKAIDRGAHPGGAEGRFWVLDPIDGTKGFLRGEQYAVALALVEGGAPVVGALACPNLPVDPAAPDGARGVLALAVRGEGTRLFGLPPEGAGARAAPPKGRPLAETVFCESVEGGHSDQSATARIAARLGITAPPLRMDSQCKYAAVARGDAQVYLRLPTRADYEEKIWDHAAGWLVVTEAGGTVTDVRGRPLDFSLGRTLRANEGVAATTGDHHAAVLGAVREVLGAKGG